ncbi:DUF4377 domain-containing protein [Aquimarina sp. W85]|uniref:DUF4377 domain-containing protein n=1 Tax=Aquimarina rhodophyticola TaxID=3342246 RepID=UPI00366DBE10
MVKKLSFYIVLIFLFSSCKETKRIFIADHYADCMGVGPQKCMLIKERLHDEWTLFYDQIEGFNYQEGFSYEIEVEINTIKNPPADGSTLTYVLSKILNKEKSESIEETPDQQPITVAYEAISRGFYLATSITKETIMTTRDQNRKETVSKECSKETWNKILSLIKPIDIKAINALQAPSGKRLFDGAAHAQLKIISIDTSYTSASFDHGEPPAQLKSLVNHILSLGESVEKE